MYKIKKLLFRLQNNINLFDVKRKKYILEKLSCLEFCKSQILPNDFCHVANHGRHITKLAAPKSSIAKVRIFKDSQAL